MAAKINHSYLGWCKKSLKMNLSDDKHIKTKVKSFDVVVHETFMTMKNLKKAYSAFVYP